MAQYLNFGILEVPLIICPFTILMGGTACILSLRTGAVRCLEVYRDIPSVLHDHDQDHDHDRDNDNDDDDDDDDDANRQHESPDTIHIHKTRINLMKSLQRS